MHRDYIICHRSSPNLNQLVGRPIEVPAFICEESDESELNIFKYRFDDTGYRGNMLHHAINNPNVSIQNLEYVVAFLRVIGCGYYDVPDSNNAIPVTLAHRRVGSYPMSVQVEKLMRELESFL